MTRSDKVFRFVGKFLIYILAVFPAYWVVSRFLIGPGTLWYQWLALWWLTMLSYLYLNRLLWPDPLERVL